MTVILADPLRARNFARSLGQRAKNDRIDAAMLARYARLDGLAGSPPKPASLQVLADWLALRHKLVGSVTPCASTPPSSPARPPSCSLPC